MEAPASDTARRSRSSLLHEAAHNAAADISRIVASRHEWHWSLRVNDAALESVNNAYWNLVEQFRVDNDLYRINNCKIAAIMIFAVLTSADDLFVRAEEADISEEYIWYCYTNICNRIMMALLQITRETIGAEPERSDRYASYDRLYHSSTPPISSLYLLCLYMQKYPPREDVLAQ